MKHVQTVYAMSVCLGLAALTTSLPSRAAGTYEDVQIQAWPGASCMIESVGNPSDTPLPVIADHEGVVEFQALSAIAQSAASGAVSALSLKCHDDTGRSQVYPVDLTSAATFAPLARTRAPTSPVRSALSGDPMSYTRTELIARGYGVRPDRMRSVSPVADETSAEA